jgi:dihydropteroate synthase
MLRRPLFNWRVRNRTLSLGEHTLVMGIVNVTPDSFSDGGNFFDSNSAVDHALAMLDGGADILDIGGESTRPNATPLTPQQEQERVLPVIQAILNARPNAILSIDTYHSQTARHAVECGVEIVNDVSGHLWDPAMSSTCASLACGTILMHTRGRPQVWRTLPPLKHDEVIPLVLSDLASRTHAAFTAGVARETIVLDPGFGFGKSFDENYPLLAGFSELHALGFPLLAGLSRKSFLSRSTQTPGTPEEIELAQNIAQALPSASQDSLPTSIANATAVLAGAHIVRVHDVPAARISTSIADRILLERTP